MNNSNVIQIEQSSPGAKTHKTNVLETIGKFQDLNFLTDISVDIWGPRTLSLKGTIGFRSLQALIESFTVTFSEKFGLIVTEN